MSPVENWWLEYTSVDEMTCVAMDFDALQNKLKLANIKICENCEQRDKTEKVVIAGAFVNCPIVYEETHTRLDLATDKHLPGNCPYKLEHIVACQDVK